jgi:hypothetical protein
MSAAKTFYDGPAYGVTVRPLAGAWTVEVAWRERGRPASMTCGHRHRSREVAGSCARAWRRRVRREVEGPTG